MASSSAKVFVKAPSSALRPYVKNFLVVEFVESVRDSHLPDTGLVAAFPYRGHCQLEDGSKAPRAGLTGLWNGIRHHVHSKDNSVVVVAFTPIGASAFFRHPLDEFAGSTVAMEQLGEVGALSFLDEQLAEAPNHFRRVELVESFLLKRMRGGATDPLVAAAILWMERKGAAARMDELVHYIGLSQSALERRFRRVVGTTPKQFASILRLKNVLRLRAAGGSLTSIAHDAGYFDQAHFIHDFKRVTGAAPEVFFAKAAVV